MRFGIGAAAPRIEDERFVTGRGRYGDDVRPDGAVVAVFVLAQVPAGRIRSIDVSAARAAPGVIGVYTAKDLDADGIGDLPCAVPRMRPLQRADGREMPVPPRGVLAREVVRFLVARSSLQRAVTVDNLRREPRPRRGVHREIQEKQ